MEEPFGLYPRALPEYPWDVLSLEPFDRHLDGKDGDLAMAGNFIEPCLEASPEPSGLRLLALAPEGQGEGWLAHP